MYISTSSFLVALDRMFQSKRYGNLLTRNSIDCKYFNFYVNFNFDRQIANKANAQKAGRPAAAAQIAPAAPILEPAAAPQNSPGGQGAQQQQVKEGPATSSGTDTSLKRHRSPETVDFKH